MRRVFGAACLWLVAAAATAQEAWVQIEAQPTRAEAAAAAENYAARLDDVAGFRLGQRWWAVALGPYDRATAEAELSRLRSGGAIPGDSYVSDGASYGERFWPADGVSVARLDEPPTRAADQTVAEARQAERLLSAREREEVQRALAFAGVYDGAVDAAFGPGTRAAMRSWQAAEGYPATGVLTAAQREVLLGGWRAVLAELGMETVRDERAGVEIAVPAGVVGFDRYAPPFARYEPTGDLPVRVLLISQPGGLATLRGLYDIMQTLPVVPPQGPRELGSRSFTIEGRGAELISWTFAELAGDAVKGFTLVWPAADEARGRRVLEEMRASFRPLPGVLGGVEDGAAPVPDLLAGLEVRRPARGLSGFYVDASGATLTAAEAVARCGRITLDDGTEAEVAARDERLGLALLRPRETMSAPATARFRSALPRIESEVAVAGFPFGGVLPAPALTWGRVAAHVEAEGRKRLALAAEEGDAGGPVLDESGAVVGVLLPHGAPGHAVAANAAAVATFLAQAGLTVAATDGDAPVAPEDLERLAVDLTVRVGCWD
ncbi:serine protease [Roseitranquillus sediminis]|uniref:serine protease n=1 Tax=Roseitranquillus sediminis TaxID=2809051 RepID=UPI002222CC01|nr:serine protease [Roseitranquillus sediminis]MBM9594671.1 trypsin-like peptidase domain-containing protein [Roseitranquillus sediminis]